MITLNPTLNNMYIFQKYQIKMRDYIENELKIQIDDISLYFIAGERYNFDFVIGDYFYNYFHDFISVELFDTSDNDCTLFERDGLEPDEYFNGCMNLNLSPVLLKDNTAKLRSKAKELIDGCIAELKLLLNENP